MQHASSPVSMSSPVVPRGAGKDAAPMPPANAGTAIALMPPDTAGASPDGHDGPPTPHSPGPNAAAAGSTTTVVHHAAAYAAPPSPVGAMPARQMSTASGLSDADKDQHRNVYVRNLAASVTAPEFHEMFKPFGEIESHKLMVDIKTGASRGFGFVMFRQYEAAAAAVAQLDGATVGGERLCVRFADPKTRKPGEATSCVFLRNLPADITEDSITELCRPDGAPTSITLRRDERHGQRGHDGFASTFAAHVEMPSVEAAAALAARVNDSHEYLDRVGAPLQAKVVEATKKLRNRVPPVISSHAAYQHHPPRGGPYGPATQPYGSSAGPQHHHHHHHAYHPHAAYQGEMSPPGAQRLPPYHPGSRGGLQQLPPQMLPPPHGGSVRVGPATTAAPMWQGGQAPIVLQQPAAFVPPGVQLVMQQSPDAAGAVGPSHYFVQTVGAAAGHEPVFFAASATSDSSDLPSPMYLHHQQQHQQQPRTVPQHGQHLSPMQLSQPPAYAPTMPPSQQ